MRPGYKQTEVGVIPEDWSLAPLSESSTSSSGTTPARSLYDRYFKGGSIPWVKTLDLNDAEISDTDEKVTALALMETSLRINPEGSVLVAMYGGFNQIGRTGLLRIPAAVNQALTAVQPNRDKVVPRFLLDVLNYRVEYWKSVASSSRKDPNITGADVRAFPLQLPPLPEQSAIATALGDVDALLAAQDALIAKKRAIKQGAMQELLTGKRRLPGFSGEWEVKRLGDVARIRNQKIATHAVDAGTLCVELENVGQGTGQLESRSTAGSAISTKYTFMTGDVLFGRLRSYLRKYWLATEPGLCTTEIWPLAADTGVLSPGYLFAIAQTDSFIDAASISFGTHMPRADWGVMRNLEIRLPPLEEQTAIAAALSDMDTELTALEAQRAKTAQLKQGMMQALLTGRIRLV